MLGNQPFGATSSLPPHIKLDNNRNPTFQKEGKVR